MKSSSTTASTTTSSTSEHEQKQVELKKLKDLDFQGLGGDFVGAFSYGLSSLEKARIQQNFENELIKGLDIDIKKVFDLTDILSHVKDGLEDVMQDDFSRCFTENPDENWNWNLYLFPLWCIGVIFRYFILLPIRVLSLVSGFLIFLFLFFIVKAIVPSQERRVWLERKLIASLCFIFVFTWTGVIRYHGVIPSKRPNQIFVANHTSLIDVIILSQAHTFSLVGQKHPGLIGFFQNDILRCLKCVWFDRNATKDRKLAGKLIKEHIISNNNNRLLVFPEGTCVNNHYCVQFKKGVFEIGAEICPIAMKYNPIFVDAFWNSRAKSFPLYLVSLMTSWAVVCDVYYLPPMKIRPNEDALLFSQRVKQKICTKAKLINVNWDGYLKHFRPSGRYIKERQKGFASSMLNGLTKDELNKVETWAEGIMEKDNMEEVKSQNVIDVKEKADKQD